jgi:hypothetical protein
VLVVPSNLVSLYATIKAIAARDLAKKKSASLYVNLKRLKKKQLDLKRLNLSAY